jgi:general secretion pathway protein H
MSATGETGTTLLEMLVVLAVTALIASLAFPNLEKGMNAITLHETVAVVASDLRAAHALALRTGQPVAFAAAADNHAYGWTGGPIHVVPAHLSIHSTDGKPLLFYPDGTASPDQIIVKGKSGATALTINPVSSNITAGGA